MELSVGLPVAGFEEAWHYRWRLGCLVDTAVAVLGFLFLWCSILFRGCESVCRPLR